MRRGAACRAPHVRQRAVIGVIVWREQLNTAGVIGIVLIIIGVILLNMFGGEQ